MKNFVPLLFLLALMVCGCTQDDMLRNGTSASGGRKFTASFEQDDSRTYVEDGRFYRWQKYDFISLFDGSTKNSIYMFDGETGDSEGTFSFVYDLEDAGAPLSANYAVYPHSEDVKMKGDGEIMVTFPSEQHYFENSFGMGDNTMVAVTKDVDDTFLNFKNVGGCLMLQLYADHSAVKSITLMGNNGEKIAGKATLNVAYDKAPTVAMEDDATGFITLDCDYQVYLGTTSEEATPFWIVVPPTTFEKGITVIVKNAVGQMFVQSTEKKLVIERNVVKPMAAVKVDMTQMSDKLIYEIPEERLEGWEEGLMVNNDYYFVTAKDTAGGTLAYLNKFDQNVENGLLFEYNSDGIITHIHDHVYIHALNFTEDSLYVSSVPVDSLSNLPIKNMELAFNYKDCQLGSKSRVSAGTMDKLALFYFAFSTSTRVKISPKEIWTTLKQIAEEEIIEFSFTTGLEKAYGKIGNVVGALFWGMDMVELYHEIVVYTYFGHTYLKVNGQRYNPDTFELMFENFNSLPTSAKYGEDRPFIYQWGVLLNGYPLKLKDNHYFKEGQTVDLGSFDMPELPEGRYEMVPFIKNESYPHRLLGNTYEFFVYKPEYTIETISVREEDEDIVAILDFSWKPVLDVIEIQSQGVSFLDSDKNEICPGLMDNGDSDIKHIKIETRIKRDLFEWNDQVATTHIKMEYWIKNWDEKEYRTTLGYHTINYENNELRDALIKLYQSTNGDNWINNKNWCSNKPLEEWYGVEINGNTCNLNLQNNSLSGIIDQKFPDDVYVNMNLEYNDITSINVSECTSLVSLKLESSELLTSLDVTGCTSLKELDCSECNLLPSLDVSDCISLNILDLGTMDQLTSLDASGCVSLKELNCRYQESLMSLDVSGCTSLVELDCSYNKKMTSLNVSGCFSLNTLTCYKSYLTSLDVSGCTSLRELDCRINQLTSLYVSGCTSLEELECSSNQLTSLEVEGCTALKSLSCDHNQLTSLDVSGFTALTTLYCNYNQLTSLNVSGTSLHTGYMKINNNPLETINASRTPLTVFTWYETRLKELKLFDCKYLRELNLPDYGLDFLYLQGCTSLTELYIENMKLIILDVSGCTSLAGIHCSHNELTRLDVANCTSLKGLYCSHNKLTSLDVSSCTSLRNLHCDDNNITSIVPNYFSQLEIFVCDARYHYREEWDESKRDWVIKYTDRGKGWWYPGEPGKGYHGPN